ncbi:MAG: hypothetical protein IT538_03335 [Variibacter sp.]|nr:hypothetical protein [Variibacter sp.]
MQLGQLIRQLSDETSAAAVLDATGDLLLVAHVTTTAQRFAETSGEYVSGAVRRFSNQADDEDWLALMNVIERSDEPGTGCLLHMVNWALRKDSAPPPDVASTKCGCGGSCNS